MTAMHIGGFWFRVFCVAVVLISLASLYFLRVTQVQVRHREILRTRYHERERVARDIHDTLLQGIQALLFRLQGWGGDRELPETLREELAAVVTQTAAMVVEGRERILSLRAKDLAPEDLVRALTAIGEAEAKRTGTAFHVRVRGRRRSLTADAGQQVFDVGREAIRNAYMHSEATRVAVSIEYNWRSLRLEIRDNGRGIDLGDLGRQEAHFGLLGMRERAAELRGQFLITPISDLGTEVCVVVPAGSAYSEGFCWKPKWHEKPQSWFDCYLASFQQSNKRGALFRRLSNEV